MMLEIKCLIHRVVLSSPKIIRYYQHAVLLPYLDVSEKWELMEKSIFKLELDNLRGVPDHD